MDYIRTESNGQLVFESSTDYLKIPSCLYGFTNTSTEMKTVRSGRSMLVFRGQLEISKQDRVCSCGSRMNLNSHPDISLQHLPFGASFSSLVFPHNQFRCPKCGATSSQYISFKAKGHRITEELYQYTKDLLAAGTYTNKEVSELTGLGKNTVKEIDLKRLKDLYTIEGKLVQPTRQAKYLGIDEFKLHNGRRYATHIIDMETGHILWIANGKKKQVVYNFIDHVGLEWMDGVEAIACDMNSDFQEAFEERCPHIQPVFDYFHLVKNFNDKVVSEIRKDEQRRLYDEGNIDAARNLKRTKYILTAKRETLQEKDSQASEKHVIHKGSALFATPTIIRKGDNEARYDALLKENKLLFTVDVIKEGLHEAYNLHDEALMAEKMMEIIDICSTSKNKRLIWFSRLIESHFEGIIAHATYWLSSGKVEGINQKIKTLRRHGFGYPDDEYFFLKLMDMSRKEYVRNPA